MSVKGFKKCEPPNKNLLLVHYMLIREMDEHSPIKLFNWTPENPEDGLSNIQKIMRKRGNKHGYGD